MPTSIKLLTPNDDLINKIYEIRGESVMLDSDLAELYGVETKVFNQSIKRNLERFPPDFMFQLTDEDWSSLRSQFVTSKKSRGGRTYLPNVFTEHGILMLSSVLNSSKAIQVNIEIVRIFSRLRQSLTSKAYLMEEFDEIRKKIDNHDKNIELIFSYIEELSKKKGQPRRPIGFMPDDL